MGGYGSGQRWDKKDTTDDYREIDIRDWKRRGLLTGHQSFSWNWSRNGETVATIQVRVEPGRIILTYNHKRWDEDKWQHKKYSVYLDWTSCHFGGKRPWFLCPAVGCERRVAILYGETVFACRHCYELAYASQQEVSYDRAARKLNKIREKLGWEPGFLNGNGWKPKGMHWKTFEKLVCKHDAYIDISLRGISQKLGLKY